MRPYVSQIKPMSEAILISDKANDELSRVIFKTESDDNNLLVNEVNEIEDLNYFKEPLPPYNLFSNGRFNVELNETVNGASNDGFMAQNMPGYEFNCEILYIDNESKSYKLLYTTSDKMMETHIDDSINQIMKKIPCNETYRIYTQNRFCNITVVLVVVE